MARWCLVVCYMGTCVRQGGGTLGSGVKVFSGVAPGYVCRRMLLLLPSFNEVVRLLSMSAAARLVRAASFRASCEQRAEVQALPT